MPAWYRILSINKCNPNKRGMNRVGVRYRSILDGVSLGSMVVFFLKYNIF